MDDLILIGTITGTHRLLGTLKINTIFPLLNEIIGKNVIIKNDFNDIRIVKVEEVKGITDKRALIDVDKIKNVNDAKELTGYKIYIRHDLIPEYEEETTVIGYSVFDKEENIGEVVDILDTAAHPILVVEKEDKEILIPFIEVFVLEILDEERKIKVKLLEGMR
ncbi:16S rRNA processing protein RimM [Streptobacillus felis]|uniref:Ribosome maturation factor RimM n=1 Tax=Streptobacillus felis TaxID=1384509 RepID=A0A7Z0PEE7_9FUSO|nr:ribosome maturation factor RimM [Streptobacillus felis]NYV27226.1 16S rRNA processing protein RimM [Streptobacillus felis]